MFSVKFLSLILKLYEQMENMIMLRIKLPQALHEGHCFTAKVLIFCSHYVWPFCYIASQ